jgi:hypothetical protein
MTERSIQKSLFWHFRSGSQILVPNYTPLDWWECDFFRVLKSGYTAEYEIKLSISDFKADFKKSDQLWHRDYTKRGEVKKHDELSGETSHKSRPNYFSFVVSEEVADKVRPLIPEYAGLMIARQAGKSVYVWVEKKPPRLHKEKKETDWFSDLGQMFYHRFWNQRAG